MFVCLERSLFQIKDRMRHVMSVKAGSLNIGHGAWALSYLSALSLAWNSIIHLPEPTTTTVHYEYVSICVFRVGNSSSIRKECPRNYQSESQLSHLSRILIRQTNALRYTVPISIYELPKGLFWKNLYINSTQSVYPESLSIYIKSNKLDTVNKPHSLNSRFKDTFSEQNTLTHLEKKPKYAG